MSHTIHDSRQCKNRSPKTDPRLVDKAKPCNERWTLLAYSENDANVTGKMGLRKQD